METTLKSAPLWIVPEGPGVASVAVLGSAASHALRQADHRAPQGEPSRAQRPENIGFPTWHAPATSCGCLRHRMIISRPLWLRVGSRCRVRPCCASCTRLRPRGSCSDMGSISPPALSCARGCARLQTPLCALRLYRF